MNKREVADRLKTYKPNEELLVEWWDRHLFEVYDCDGEPKGVTKALWDKVLSEYQPPEHAMTAIYEALQEALQEEHDRQGDDRAPTTPGKDE